VQIVSSAERWLKDMMGNSSTLYSVLPVKFRKKSRFSSRKNPDHGNIGWELEFWE